MNFEEYVVEMNELIASGVDPEEAHNKIYWKNELSWKTGSLFYLKWKQLEATGKKC